MADKQQEKPAGQPMTAEQIGEFIKQAVSQSVAAGMALQQASKAPQAPVAPQFAGECQTCGQKLVGCKNQHRMVVLFPKNPIVLDQLGWSGVVINGKVYRSNGPGHKIPVPADSCPEAILAAWEAAEITMSQGRKAAHNSGHLSGRGNSRTFSSEGKGWS